MDELLALLLSYPNQPQSSHPPTDKQNDDQLKALTYKLRQITPRQLLPRDGDWEGILEFLDPALNTISYAFVLLAGVKRFDGALKNAIDEHLPSITKLWFTIVHFLNVADLTQVRYVGKEIREIVYFLEPLSHALRKDGAAVAPMARFILRLDPEGSTLSSQHLLMCQISLRTGSFQDAAQVLERDIVFLPSETSQHDHTYMCSPHLTPQQFITEETGLTRVLTPSNIQEYFLLGGSILIGLRKWSRAAQLLENVVSYPVKFGAVSSPMVEAYKKWLLVQLMLNGRVSKMSKMVNSKTVDVFRTMAAPYEAVSSIFEEGTMSRLKAEISAGADLWRQDGNAGLMRTVRDSYQERQILGMASVFTTVPVSYIVQATSATDIIQPVDEKAVFDLISLMIKRSQLRGQLTTDSQGQSFLCFQEPETAHEEEITTIQLPAAVAQVDEVVRSVGAFARVIATERDYVRWMHKQAKTGGGVGALPSEDIGWPPVGPDDEDLMAN